MKIRKKVHESPYEKRNTPLLTFASVAVIPLLLSFLLGTNLGKVTNVNTENMLQQINLLESERDSLQQVVIQGRDQVNSIYSAFEQIDSVVEVYKEEVFKSLQDQLSTAQGELDLHRWENDMREQLDDFKHRVSEQTRRLEFDDNHALEGVISFANRWLGTYAQAKGTELFASKISRSVALGQAIDADLQTRIDQLQQDLTNCQDQRSVSTQEMTRVQIELDRAREKLGEGEKKIKTNSSSKNAQIADLKKQVEDCEVKGATAKGVVAGHLQSIETELLKLEGQRFLQLRNNQKEVDKLKGQISIILNQIRTSIQEL